MSRNANSRFALNPTNIDIQRSKFGMNHSVKFSGNIGDIIPFDIQEVLPGDTFQYNTSKLLRMQTLIAPVMDNIFLDTYYFYVPTRLTWEHWKQFNGENTESKWIPTTTYQVPQITSPEETGWAVGTIADYLGIPIGVPGISVNALPFRAYAMICNEWFRDENNSDPLDIPLGDATVAGVNTNTFITDVAKGGKPYKAAKYHDYFTSALPAPQKGPDVSLAIAEGTFPVVGNGNSLALVSSLDVTGIESCTIGGTATTGGAAQRTDHISNNHFVNSLGNNVTARTYMGVPTLDQLVSPEASGLITYLQDVPVASINSLRLAFATQRMYERDARGGSRYVEMIKSHFGVTSPDARQQRPEYLGGNRIPININQVVQTSGEIGETPQGNVAGYSVTSDTHGDFIKSFTEHGYVIGVCVARYEHTYQQGLNKLWSRLDRTDFYLPVFANLGEQPILNKEIYLTGTDTDDEVFGYQEAWSEYRYTPSRVAGEMRSTAPTSLDVWHLGDNYSEVPVLQSDWIFEDKANVDRALQITSDVANQFWADFYIQVEATRPMPLYSIPGLLDHN